MGGNHVIPDILFFKARLKQRQQPLTTVNGPNN
uniref:Uncharacterized protein n=1 Tax=Arundo donax TaxID=35708 RepID=A0A0A9CKQ6_ARUDO